MSFLDDSNWIWVPEWNLEDKDNTRLVYFRKVIEITAEPISAKVDITADSRYKLYVNGQLVQFGPSKGDNQIWFCDSVDIADYLKKGKNTICVIVLRYPEDKKKGNHSIFRTAVPSLYMKGKCTDALGHTYTLSSDSSWKCFVDRQFRIIQEEIGFAPLMIHEEYYGNKDNQHWMCEDFSDEYWDDAKPYKNIEVHGAVSPGNLHPRTIPFMYRKKRNFAGIMDIKKSIHREKAWKCLLNGEAKIIIPANTEEIVEFDAGEEMTGFLKLQVSGGKDSVIEILQSEGYVLDGFVGAAKMPLKGDRTDKEHGHLDGYTDIYHVAGLGTNEKTEVYEPFWFRTFRFIQLKIKTGDQPLVVHSFDYEETGYPLEVETEVKTSDESLKDIWEISERTLRRCMHETYMDCPFYEQLQYAMDARQEILYTYAISADDRLARKCMDDFRRSQRYDGLINCCYPNCNPNVIPGFSIYYVMMVYDHMMYFGDKELIRYHMPAIERILDFFERNLTIEGYVGKVGVPNLESAFWSFIDWANAWDSATGMPLAGLQGPITMESLLYIMGLQHAAKLAEYIGRHELASEYLQHAANVQEAIRKHCIGKNGMVQDGPGVDIYSQHCQVFALLTDTVDLDIGRRNLLETLENTSAYAQCTVCMQYYVFRALEKVDLYEYTNQKWDIWRVMLEKHATTCIEAELYCRSDCHAWGSLILFELPSVTLGVRPASPGYETVSIKPVPGYLDCAEGQVKTPRGIVKVSWKKENGEMKVSYELPDGMEDSIINS